MSDPVSSPLLALIKERGLLDDLQFEEVSQEVQRSGKPVSRSAQDFGIWTRTPILQVVADHLGTEVVDMAIGRPRKPLKAVPRPPPRCTSAFRYALHGSTLQLALADPLNPAALDELGFSSPRNRAGRGSTGGHPAGH
jgi:hypothetical protein